MSLISVKHLKKSFGDTDVLSDINLEINRGDVISIIGPSGTGKSTLLRCLNLLEEPDAGEILIDGVNLLDPNTDVTKVRLKIGMVFQSFNLFSHLMVIENLMLGPVELLGMDRQQAYDEAMEYLSMVGLASKAKAYPDELSGGQKQRVAIARTLAMHPEIILLDEPTSALDPTMVSEVLSVIRRLVKSGMTMMIVTHEMRFAHDVSSEVVYLDEGVIYEMGTPEQIFDHPTRPKTNQFVHKIRTMEYNLTGSEIDMFALAAQVDEFCAHYFLSMQQTKALQALADDLIHDNILTHPSYGGQLHVEVRYSENTDQITMRVEYSGAQFNVFESNVDSENSARLESVREYIENPQYEYQDGLNILVLPLL